MIAELREDDDDVWLGVVKAMAERRFRKFPEIQVDEAELVARSSGSRSCGAPVIARRNFVWR
jgi:hypothetical protein